MAYAIGTYLMFMEMFGLDYRKPTYNDISKYALFLTGRNIVPEPGSKVTYRCANSANGYMSMTRIFLLLTHNETSAFEQQGGSKLKNLQYVDIYGRRHIRSRSVNPHHLRRDPLMDRELPSHPKPNQVAVIIAESMKDTKNPGITCAINVQVRTAIRRGGLLGLTLEDVCAEWNGKEYEYCIYLRNRVSDNEDQACKGLYHPQNRDEYGSQDYLDSHQRIPITKKLYDKIMDYYKTSRDEALVGVKMRKKILENTKADSIFDPKKPNYYIFAMSNGKLLTGQTYNNHLKKFYKVAGVTLDKHYKHYNCSHQLRSAALMFRARYSKHPIGLLELARDAGHASPNSTMRYLNEFPEDVRARAELFDAELDELLPETENVHPNEDGHE